jgi:NAD(P)-dependent dehydrogenase (short-subunit alcohol dehydrogenase family)
MSLRDQVAIVTGASSDIGKAIAFALAEHDASIVLVGRDIEALDLIATVIRERGHLAHVIRCDVTNGQQVESMVEEVRTAFNDRVDILVNVAGGTLGMGAPVWELSEGDFRRIIELNLTSSFLTVAAVLPVMIARRSGRIINIGGTYGMRGRAGRSAYSAAKWGLRGLTKSAALEAGPFGITVNCVSPGLVEGPRLDEMGAEAASHVVENLALRRVTTPADIANMVCFLAGEGGRQVTGQDLVVDGGSLI